MGIAKIEASELGGAIEFSDSTQIDPMKIVMLMQTQPSVYKMEGANKLKFAKATKEAKDRFILVESVLAELLKS